MKVIVDGQEVFRTETKWGKRYPNFRETYFSNRMRKDARITIEMWDDDSRPRDWGSPDDLMSRWDNQSVDLLLKYSYLMGNPRDGIWQNRIDYTSSWRDEKPNNT